MKLNKFFVFSLILFFESIVFAMEKPESKIVMLLTQLKEEHQKGQEKSFIASLPQELRAMLAKQYEENAIIQSLLDSKPARLEGKTISQYLNGKSIYDLNDAEKFKLLRLLYRRPSDNMNLPSHYKADIEEYINPLLQLKTFSSIANDPKKINELFENNEMMIAMVDAPAAVSIFRKSLKESGEEINQNRLNGDILWFREKDFGHKKLNLVGIKNRLNAGVNPNFERPHYIQEKDEYVFVTPLLLAIKAHLPIDIIKLLIEKKADINAKTRTGQTPLSFAKEYGSPEVIQLLLEKGAKE